MINQIRADFYRQYHTRGVWLTALLTVAYSAAICWFQEPGGIMVNAPQHMLADLATKKWTVYDGIRSAMISSSVLVYLFIGLFVIVIGYEFSQHTYKNTLLTGISRLGFILGKYVTLLVDLFLGMTLYFATALVVGLLHGLPGGDWTATAKLVGGGVVMSTFFVSVVFSLGLLLLILTRSTVMTAVFIVVWPLAISLLSIATEWHWLSYFDFFNTESGIAFGLIAQGDIWRYILVSAVVLVGSIGVGTVLIRRQEL
ncbi:ABC transporter permease [Lacticaseibacillus suihuaensis]